MNLADEWVPVRPGTDAALVAGFAHVMITEDLLDHAFLDKYCSGFDEDHMPAGIPAGMSYESYVLGKGKDKTEKRRSGLPASPASLPTTSAAWPARSPRPSRST